VLIFSISFSTIISAEQAADPAVSVAGGGVVQVGYPTSCMDRTGSSIPYGEHNRDDSTDPLVFRDIDRFLPDVNNFIEWE